MLDAGEQLQMVGHVRSIEDGDGAVAELGREGVVGLRARQEKRTCSTSLAKGSQRGRPASVAALTLQVGEVVLLEEGRVRERARAAHVAGQLVAHVRRAEAVPARLSVPRVGLGRGLGPE